MTFFGIIFTVMTFYHRRQFKLKLKSLNRDDIYSFEKYTEAINKIKYLETELQTVI